MTLPWALIAVCLADGEVRTPTGAPVAGAQVIDAARAVVLGTTSDEGGFAIEVPGATDETVLEFRAVGHVPSVTRVRCGDTIDVTLRPQTWALEAVEVSATRLERAFEASAVRVEKLDRSDVANSAASLPTLSQAVQQLPGLGAIGRDGLTSAPTIRGFARDRSLILLEGMRISSDRGVGPTAGFVDPFLIRRVDVIRGASGVAYGSGAIGGVVSVGLGGTGEALDAEARLAGATNGDGKLVAGRVTGSPGRDWDGAAGLFLRAQNDYSFPHGDAVNSGFENAGVTGVLETKVRRGRIRLALLGTTANEVGRPTTIPGRLDVIEDEDHGLGTARFLEDVDGRRTELGFGFHRPRSVNRTERFDAGGERTYTGRVENESWDLGASGLVERPLARGSWLAGIDLFTRFRVDATETNVRYSGGIAQPAEIEHPVSNGTRIDVGAFAAWKRTIRYVGHVVLAARLDEATRRADDRSSVSWLAPSVTAGIVFPLNASWQLTGSLARSFRAPRIQELYFAGDRPGGTRLANPDLEPETAWSLEGLLRWSRGSWSSQLATWGMAANDLIVQLPIRAGSDTLRNENVVEGRYGGVELELRWAPADGHARATAGYALMTGEDDSGGPLPDVMPGVFRTTGELRILGDASGRSATLRAALRAGAAKTPVPGGGDERWWSPLLGSTAIGGDEQGHPGFARWDLGLRVRAARLLVIDVAVTNLLDEAYLDRAEADAYPQPGRSFLFELTVGD